MNFHIVEFHDGLQVVPFGWLSDDIKQAYWPPYEDKIRLCKAIVNMETPAKDVWKLIDVLAIIGSADKYPEATEKLKLMKDASDLENFASEETFKKSRARRHRVLTPLSSEDDEAAASELLEVTSNKKKTTGGNGKKLASFPKKPGNFVTVTENIRISNVEHQVSNTLPTTSAKQRPAAGDKSAKENGSQSIIREKTAGSEKHGNDNSAAQRRPSGEAPEFITLTDLHEELLRVMNKVATGIKDLDNRFKTIENSFTAITLRSTGQENTNEDAEQDALENILPLNTFLEFDEFEKRLLDKKFAARMIQFLRRLGGTSTHGFLFNSLKRSLANVIAKEYSMDGRKKKKVFKDTNFLRMIIKTTKLHLPSSDEDSIKKIVSGWLAGAKLRYDREIAKLGSNGDPETKENEMEERIED